MLKSFPLVAEMVRVVSKGCYKRAKDATALALALAVR
jgi:hypothetical protein